MNSAPRLGRNAALNLAGFAIPALAGLIAIPLLVRSLGAERFGLLTIIWAGLGFLSIADIGLGQALTQLLAERHGSKQGDDAGPVIWTALWLLSLLGATAGILVTWTARPLVEQVLLVPPELQSETIRAVQLIAFALPATLVTKGLVGVLAAEQRFGIINVVRVPSGILTLAAPLATAQFSPNLADATAALVGAKLLALAAYALAAGLVQPESRRPAAPRSEFVGQLLRFGGWLLLVQLMRPFLVYADRFIIGALLGMASLAFYVTPFALTQRLSLLSQSVISVLFPAMTTAIAVERERLPQLHAEATRLLFLVMLPPTFGLFLLAPEALDLWLGASFRVASTPVMRWLAAASLVIALTGPSYTVLLSSGRPDLLAKVNSAQLLPYLLSLWIMTKRFGIVGTAVAWFSFVLFNALVLNFLARKRLPDLRANARRTQVMLGGSLAGFLLAVLIEPLVARVIVVALVAATCGFYLRPTIADVFRQPR